MTREEMQKVQPAQEYIRKLQQKRNAGTEDCMLSTDLAREMGIERSTYELKLSKDFAGLGYAKTRSHFRYSRRGDLIEKRFPVWTEKGQEYIKKLIKGLKN